MGPPTEGGQGKAERTPSPSKEVCTANARD